MQNAPDDALYLRRPMRSNLTPELDRAFELASLRFEASHNLSGDAWSRYREITGRYEGERKQKARSFRREYDARVEAARARLIEQAARKKCEHRPRFGSRDAFDPAIIERQAHREVKHEHVVDMARTDEGEREDLRGLLGEARRTGVTVRAAFADSIRAPVLDLREGTTRARIRSR